ncbi:hypothetical protein GCM10028858_11990 [Halorubrum pallidum]
MLHGDDHAEWLDDHVADWADRDPDGLAAEVTEHAEAAEYHEVFEDTVDRGRPDVDVGAHAGRARGDHAHDGRGHAHGSAASPGVVDESGATDPETAEALEEAKEMTREMLSDGSADDDDANRDDDTNRNGDAERDDPTA